MANTLDKIKLSGVTYDIIDATAIHSMDGYWTSGQTESAITAATDALAQAIAEQGYQTSGDVQSAITEATSGINNTLTAHTANTDIHVTTADKTVWNAKADISDIPSVSGYADAVKSNTSSKYVEFYHGGTGGTVVFSYDASPFLIDGMVESVVITSITSGSSTVQVLEITWNSAAGGQVTDIPLSEIFDPSNYYTKTEVDNSIDAATSGKVDNDTYTAYTAATDTVLGNKADTSALTAVNDVLTAHTADTTIHVTSSDKSTWSGKQDALVNQVNIKSINGTSLLGSGDITVQSLPTVSGTTLVFS